jgi:acyl-CoA synthetase (AMP-forming)/AMP-acid ligase II
MEEVDVVDGETGRSVSHDGSTMGEIVLRGGCVMLGYLNDDEATGAAIRDDGWFYTGDVSVVHPDGYLEIRDRSKDVIINAGENISSVEVESVLYAHPAVNEAAVRWWRGPTSHGARRRARSSASRRTRRGR